MPEDRVERRLRLRVFSGAMQDVREANAADGTRCRGFAEKRFRLFRKARFIIPRADLHIDFMRKLAARHILLQRLARGSRQVQFVPHRMEERKYVAEQSRHREVRASALALRNDLHKQAVKVVRLVGE